MTSLWAIAFSGWSSSAVLLAPPSELRRLRAPPFPGAEYCPATSFTTTPTLSSSPSSSRSGIPSSSRTSRELRLGMNGAAGAAGAVAES
uniref:Secreted protein n=1 Tax=Zea mays TaxID=4577 RepID=C4J2Y2_MAIZE|nr:unknown [Zea mays]